VTVSGRPTTSKAAVSAATMSVYAPTRVRGGLIYEARFHITAHQEIKNAVLVLGTGWLVAARLNRAIRRRVEGAT